MTRPAQSSPSASPSAAVCWIADWKTGSSSLSKEQIQSKSQGELFPKKQAPSIRQRPFEEKDEFPSA